MPNAMQNATHSIGLLTLIFLVHTRAEPNNQACKVHNSDECTITTPTSAAQRKNGFTSTDIAKVLASEQPTSAAQRKNGFSSADIAKVLASEQQVWNDQTHADLSNNTRIFGEKSEDSLGHSATYLHAHIDQGLLDKLLSIAMELEAEAGWRIASSGVFKNLYPRAVESIRYSSSSNNSNGDVEIGWHSDFMSVMTVSVMLSPPRSFTGGVFQTRRLGSEDESAPVQNYTLNQGDVTVWKSWDRHRVAPLVAGHRHVFVVQFWTAPAHVDKRLGPAPDFYFTESTDMLLPYCDAITSVDPESFYAAQICGKWIRNVGVKLQRQSNMPAQHLFELSIVYHKRAANIASESIMLRTPLLGQAQSQSRIVFAPSVHPTSNQLQHLLQLCEKVHTLGDLHGLSLQTQKKDLGNTVLHMLKQAIRVPQLELGTQDSFVHEFPFLELYWR